MNIIEADSFTGSKNARIIIIIIINIEKKHTKNQKLNVLIKITTIHIEIDLN